MARKKHKPLALYIIGCVLYVFFVSYLLFTLSSQNAYGAIRTVNLLSAPGPPLSKIWLAPTTYDGTLKGPVGPEGLTSEPTWHIAQWGIPEELPEQFTDLGNRSWKIENTFAAATFTPLGSTYTVQLQQKVSDFDCTKEFDLLIEPTEARAYPPNPSTAEPKEAFIPEEERPSLALMDALRMQTTSRLISATQGTKCGLDTNPETQDLASTVFAIVFHNDAKNQGLFYQLATYDSRPGKTFNGEWFGTDEDLADETEDLFGVSDSVSIPELGGTLLTKGGSAITYNLNIAPRIKSLISSGHGGIDTELKNWKVFGAYYGSYVSPGSTITSEYSSLDITSTIIVPTCSLAFEPAASASPVTTVKRTWSSTGDADSVIPYACTSGFSEDLAPAGEDTFEIREGAFPIGSFPPDSHVLECTITAESASGELEECTASFTLDTTPPTISITSPQDGETVSGTVTITADAADEESGIAQVEFFVNDKSIGIDAAAPYEMKWDSVKTLVETASLPFFKKFATFLLAPIARAGDSAVIKTVAANGAGLSSTSAAVSTDITCPEVPLPKLLGDIPSPCQGPAEYIQYWFYFGLYLAGIAALLAAVAGGTLYMVSATMKTAATGKKLMTNALLGLILLFGSWLLLTTLGGAGLTTLKNPVLPGLPCLQETSTRVVTKEGDFCTNTGQCAGALGGSFKCIFSKPTGATCGTGLCYDGSIGDSCNSKIGTISVNTCQAGLVCNDPDGDGFGICETPRSTVTCSSPSDCPSSSPFCVAFNPASSTVGVCRNGSSGELCNTEIMGTPVNQCAHGLTCQDSDGDLLGICQ